MVFHCARRYHFRLAASTSGGIAIGVGLCFSELLGSFPPDVFSTEGFCSRLLEVNNSVERNVIRRITRVDTNEVCSNLRNLAADGLVSNEGEKGVLPLECIQHGLKFFHGGDSTSAVH